MIARIDALPALSVCTPALTRLCAMAAAYGSGYDFCRLYAQMSEETYTALALDFYGTLYVCPLDGADYTELAEFYRMRSDLTAFHTHDAMFAKQFDRVQSGTVWCKPNSKTPPIDSATLAVNYPESFAMLTETFPKLVHADDYSLWYCDFAHRARRNIGGVYCYTAADGTPLSTITVYGMDADYAFLGQIAVREKGKGTGGQMLQAIGAAVDSANLAVDSKSPRADGFYRKQGFSEYGHWYQHRKIQEL